MERSDRVNFSSTVKKTEMPFTNVWSEDISFRRVTSWIRASKKDFELVKEIGMQETGILGKLF